MINIQDIHLKVKIPTVELRSFICAKSLSKIKFLFKKYKITSLHDKIYYLAYACGIDYINVESINKLTSKDLEFLENCFENKILSNFQDLEFEINKNNNNINNRGKL